MITAALAACVLAASSPSSEAQFVGPLRIGQTAPAGSPATCVGATDQLQPGVNGGPSYVVPTIPPATNLVLVGWSHLAAAATPAPALTMKVFRKVAEPATYMVIGHDGPHTLNLGTYNFFRVRIPVQPGDVLGLHSDNPASTACTFSAPGNPAPLMGPIPSNLADGQSGPFTPESAGSRLNISAFVQPENGFTVRGIRRHPTRGTATVTVDVPNPGRIGFFNSKAEMIGNGDTKAVRAAGSATVGVRAKGATMRKLRRTGKVRVKFDLNYFPTGGQPSSHAVSLALVKR